MSCKYRRNRRSPQHRQDTGRRVQTTVCTIQSVFHSVYIVLYTATTTTAKGNNTYSTVYSLHCLLATHSLLTRYSLATPYTVPSIAVLQPPILDIVNTPLLTTRRHDSGEQSQAYVALIYLLDRTDSACACIPPICTIMRCPASYRFPAPYTQYIPCTSMVNPRPAERNGLSVLRPSLDAKEVKKKTHIHTTTEDHFLSSSALTPNLP